MRSVRCNKCGIVDNSDKTPVMGTLLCDPHDWVELGKHFTFHVPYTQHDEYVVEAETLEDAREKLWNGIRDRKLLPARRAITDVPDTDYEDVSDCNAFDEDGNAVEEVKA